MEHTSDHGAADFLRQRDLTAQITEDLSALGYVGEDENKLLTYSGAVSRKLDKPLGVVIQGSSGSGKSELVEKVLSLCPEEDVFFYTRLTAQSLYYIGLQDPFGLAHKVVAVEEAKGAEEANYALRVLLTRRRLDLQTTLHQTAVHIVLHGPVAYLDTTTGDLTDDETANRVLQVRMDASEAQTKAVLDAQRQRAATVPGPADQAIIARHQAAQRLLQPIPVIIPFAQQIPFPTQHTRARRDHQRLLDLVCAIAFLHQYQRRHGQAQGVDFIEASPDDYDLAAQLMQRCLGYAFDDLSPKARELYECIQRRLREQSQSTVTRGDIVRWTSWKLGPVRKQLAQLVELGYLRKLTGSKGQEYVYRLAESPQGAPSWRLGALTGDGGAANGPEAEVAGNGQNGHHRDGHEDMLKGSLMEV
jgi:DNA primase